VLPLLGARAGVGLGSTAIELGAVRARRSADFSPPPAVSPGRQGSGLKSALLNSMAVLHGPLPTPSSYGEGTPLRGNGGTVETRPRCIRKTR